MYARALKAAELADDKRGPGDDGVLFWFDAKTARYTQKKARTKTFHAYGGDWGDNPNDGAFSGDGIVLPDRRLTGKSAEVKRIYQPVTATRQEGAAPGEITLTNDNLFTGLRAYEGHWEVSLDGEITAHGKLSRAQLDVPPMTGKRITLPIELPRDPAPGAEYFLQLSFTTKERTPWADAGFEVARIQLPLDAGSPEVVPAPLTSVPELTYRRSDTAVTVTGRGFEVIIDTATGLISSYEAAGTKLLTSGPIPNFWRAPTDNDRGSGQHTRNQTWRDAGARREVTGVTVRELDGHAVEITVKGTLPTATTSAYTTTCTVFGNGEIKVDNTLSPGATTLPYLPEIGTILHLPAALDRLHYYGRGPEENHWDRNDGTDVGRWSGTVAEQWSPYLRPQENGNKTDVRWAALTDSRGHGLLVSGDGLLEVNASHFTPEDLSVGARHDYQLTPRDEVILRVNHRQMGIGGDDSWGAQTHDAYKLPADRDYSYTYRLRPLTDVRQATALSRRPTAAE